MAATPAFTAADEQQAVAAVVQVRSHLVQAYTDAFSSPSGPLLAALVMGQKMAHVPDMIREDFRRAGLSHALAASGFHLSVLLSSVLLIAGQRRLLRLGLGVCVILGFIALAGPQPSVVRAALMAGLGLLLLSLKTRQRPVGVLLAAVITMLLIAPVWVQSLGFQFSVVATMGLVVSAGPMGEGLSRWLPQRLAMAMAVPLAATCWTIPLQLLHFGRLPLYGIPVNLLLTPRPGAPHPDGHGHGAGVAAAASVHGLAPGGGAACGATGGAVFSLHRPWRRPLAHGGGAPGAAGAHGGPAAGGGLSLVAGAPTYRGGRGSMAAAVAGSRIAASGPGPATADALLR